MLKRPMAAGVALTISGALLAIPATGLAAPDTVSAAAAKPEGVAAQLAAMQARMDELQAQNHALQEEITAMRPQLEALQAKVAAASARSTQGAAAHTEVTVASKAEAKAEVASTEPRRTAMDWDTSTTPTRDTGITLGGAVRFQYTSGDYDQGIDRRHGDMQFDIFRLDLNGKVHGILLSAQWRWFQYMSAIQHAWVGYDFTPKSQLQVGLTRIPFGNQPFDSHSYFFSSNYYLGLEDTYAAGVEYVYAGDPWNLQLAFFKNDATGGVGASGDRTHSYSYDVVGVRAPGEGIFDKPSHPAGSIDTLASRLAYTFHPQPDLSWQVGASGMYGGLQSPAQRIGHYYALALHTNVDYGRWNFQLQAARYAYHTDDDATRLAVGAYAFYDTIPAQANTYTANVRYHLPVAWGPIEGLDFYNDFSLVTNKSGGLRNTFFDDLGVGVSAGDLYTYLDFLTGRNQPFNGGSMAGDGPVDHRINVNFGFYF